MSVWTLFGRLQTALSNGEDTNPETAGLYTNPSGTVRHNVIQYRSESFSLDDGDTRAVTFLPTTADVGWVLIVARVIGTAKLEVAGTIPGPTSITGAIGGFGTADHPGIIGNVGVAGDSFAFTGLADGTDITYIACILAEDDEL